MLHFYGYDSCSTCRKARKWLDEHGVAYEAVDITQQPPRADELRELLKRDDIELRHLFNTSGQLYRGMNLKEKLPGMSEAEATDLLAGHGKLVKRPIVIADDGRATVGFKPERFEQMWG